MELDDTTEIEQPEAIEPETTDAPEVEQQVEEEGPLVVQIGDEADDVTEDEVSKAPAWVQELRRRNQETQKEKRNLERRVKELEAANAPAVDELGPEPQLDDPEYDFDTDAWKGAWKKWDAKRTEIEGRAQQAQQAFQGRVTAYNEAKAKLPVPDFGDAEAYVQDVLDVTQQGLIVKVAKDAPTLVYALGKNPKQAERLAAIKDYAEFVAELVRLEMNVKTTRKPTVRPETAIDVPTGTGVATTDNTLERLREDAVRTGDYTKVMRYKRERAA